MDECVVGGHTCDAIGGVCTNTVGSSTCACQSGFIGDGHSCTGTIASLLSSVELCFRDAIIYILSWVA